MLRPIDFTAIDYRLDFRGRNDFFIPAYTGDNTRIKKLLKSDERFVFNAAVRSQGFQNIAHVACYGSSNAETITTLHEAGANFEALDETKRLPWHIAANAGDPNILRELQKAYADKPELMISKDINQRTALHAICMSGSSPEEKRRNDELKESLGVLLASYTTDNVRIAALQEEDKFGITPLMYAQYYGYTEILDFAGTLGIKVTGIRKVSSRDFGVTVDYFGRLPIQEAAFDNKPEEVERLFNEDRYYNDPTIGNPQFANMNALHYAASGGGVGVMGTILADERTNPASVDDFGNTCLHFAAARADHVLLNFMLRSPKIKALVNVTNKYGETPLHALAMNLSSTPEKAAQRLSCIATLVGAGADMYLENNRSDKPSDVANERKNDQVAQELTSLMSAHRVLAESSVSAKGCLWSFRHNVESLAAKVKSCFVDEPKQERRNAIRNGM